MVPHALYPSTAVDSKWLEFLIFNGIDAQDLALGGMRTWGQNEIASIL